MVRSAAEAAGEIAGQLTETNKARDVRGQDAQHENAHNQGEHPFQHSGNATSL